MTSFECVGLGKRYRRKWALRDCSLAVPAGRITALVGPNGAGKTTLLHCLTGLIRPTEGRVSVLEGYPAGSLEALGAVGFVAQNAPLYGHLSVAGMIELTACMNRRFDVAGARSRAEELGLPPTAKVRRLSGGQQAQLALGLALARHPRMLVLDEPMARLDPVARHSFMGSLMTTACEDGVSIVFSSHVVSELERVADHLILVSRGRIVTAGPIDELLTGHAVLTGPVDQAGGVARALRPLRARRAGRQAQLLVRRSEAGTPDGWEVAAPTLEELVLAYLSDPPDGAAEGARIEIAG